MNKAIVYLLIVLMCGTACVKEIPAPNVDKRSLIAASCILTNSDVQKLTLTYGKPARSGQFFDEVEQAVATLYQDDEEVGVFSKAGYADWELKYRPIAGKSYRLRIEIPGATTLSATTTMPEAVDIISEGTTDNNHTKVFAQQKVAVPFWMFCMESSLIDIEYHLNPPPLAEDSKARLFQQIGTDHKNADRFNQEGSSSDFSSLYGNTLAYNFYVRVAPNTNDGEETPYVFRVQHRDTEASFVVFRAVSEEYDRYLKSIMEKMTYYESEDDPAQWFDESVIYSNIENGLGIFGAYRQTSFYYNNTIVSEEL